MRILCVENSPLGLLHLKHNTRRIAPGATIRGCRDPEKAVALARKEGCDVLLTEIELNNSKWAGIFLARRIKSINPRVNIIFVTVLSERECAEEVLRLRVSGFVTKPYQLKTLAEEFANLRYPIAADAACPSPGANADHYPLSPRQMEAVVGGKALPGRYVPGPYKEEAKAFFRQCVGDETYERAMGSDAGHRHHYVAARVCLNQTDWEKFTWIEQFGSLDGYPH